jgi:hypothetical protein
MGCFGRARALGVVLVLAAGLAATAPAQAPAPAPAPAPAKTPAQANAQRPSKIAVRTVYGKIEMVNESVRGLAIVADDGQRMAWQLDKKVIDQVKAFKPGDSVIVIYRERGAGKAVTAIAFPGKAETPLYVNTTGERVELVSGPMVDDACGKAPEASIHRTTIPTGARAETQDACWCCAPAGQACVPSNRTGLGQAFLIHCYP